MTTPKRKRVGLWWLLTLACAGLLSADVSFEEETRMGGFSGFPTGPGLGTRTRTEVSGPFMRLETATEVTIVDLEQKRILTLDTTRKTFLVTTFDELRRRLRSAISSRPGAGAGDSGGPSDVRVNETGRTEVIDGHECRELELELDVRIENPVDDAAGTVTMVSELWVARDVPGLDELERFQERMADELGASVLAQTPLGAGSANPFGADIDERQLADEMEKIDGFPMRTIVYFGSRGGARDDATVAPPASTPTAPPGMRVTTERKNVSTKPIPPGRFAIPEGYREISER